MSNKQNDHPEPKNVEVRGVIEARFTPDFLKDIKTGQTQEHTRETNRFRVEIATIIIVFVYTSVAFWQGCSSQKSAETAGKAAIAAKEANTSLISSQRAFLFAAPYEVYAPKVPVKSANDHWNLQFWWENNGSTPARFVTTHLNWEYRDGPLPDNFDFPDRWQPSSKNINAPTYVSPKGRLGVPGLVVPQFVINGIRLQHRHFYIWGWVHYKDIFPGTPEHVTKLCHEIVLTDTDPILTSPFRFDSCPRNNCADEECNAQQ